MSEELNLPLEALQALGFTELPSALEPVNNRVVRVIREPGDVKVWLEFDLEELNALKALMENPHPIYKKIDHPTGEIATRVFNDIKDVY